MRAISAIPRPGWTKRKYKFMNAEIQQYKNKSENTIKLEAELERRFKKSQKYKQQLEALQEKASKSVETQYPTEATKRQISNYNKQIRNFTPNIRGGTTTHVGSPRLGPFVRKPRDPITLSKGQVRNTASRRRAPALQTPNGLTHPQVVGAKVGQLSRGKRNPSNLGSGSPTIAGRQVAKARVGPSDPYNIQERLKKKSPWLQSIVEPISGGGVKIPDPVGTDTGTWQHVQSVSVQVGPQGCAGLRIVCPYINSYKELNTNPNGCNYQITTGTSSTATLAWGAGATLGGMISFQKTPEIIKASAQSHRVVSASVVAQPEISTLGDAGEMLAFVKPFSANAFDVTYQEMQAQWDSCMMPVNQHKAFGAKWYPCQSDYNLHDGSEEVKITGEPATISYQDFIDPDVDTEADGENSGVIPWELGVICSGMTPSVGLVRFQIVVNYEFIPKTNAGVIQATPDACDITESNLVGGWVSDLDVTGPVSQRAASKPPSSDPVPPEPSGFGMIFNVMEEMLPLIPKALALL